MAAEVEGIIRLDLKTNKIMENVQLPSLMSRNETLDVFHAERHFANMC